MSDTQKRRVNIIVDSDREPVITDGYITERADGFTLEFRIGGDSYVIEHAETHTRVKADGIMSYDIRVCPEGSSTLLATPYGNVRFAVTERTRAVVKRDGGWDIDLSYTLASGAAGDMERAVQILARYREY